MADEVFEDIQVLRGLTVSDFMGTMGFISASLAMNCSECHDTTSSAGYATQHPRKDMARKMIVMTGLMNQMNFGGQRKVTCWSCHRGGDRPEIIPSLVQQYAAPPDDDPNNIEPYEEPPAHVIPPDQIFDKYIAALGGAEKLAGLRSFVASGTYVGFDTAHALVPVDIYANAPAQRTTVVHLGSGDSVRVFNGSNAWVTSEGTLMPIPVVPLAGGELAGAKLDAQLSFPGRVKQLFSNWTSSFPYVFIDDEPMNVVQAMQPDNTPVKLFFNKESGLLVRYTRFTETPIGLIPTQVDFSDYRDVAGVKMPFKLTWTWTDGQVFLELKEIRPNVAIPATRFSRPVPPAR
jgi:hypothetical protein